MKLDARLRPHPAAVAQLAQQLEAAGYERAWTAETNHDPFLALGLAAASTERIELGTFIAVAFARNPLTTAHLGWDLQTLSGGRFVLGLGSQVKPHIVGRFSMPWSHPVSRMEEYVAALHAIWDSWESGGQLDFRGEFYRHSIRHPMFVPPPQPHGRPKVHLGAVGTRMARMVGRVADGLLCNAIGTADYLREVTLPALREGLAEAGRPPSAVEVSQLVMVVVAETDESYEYQSRLTRWRIGNACSTPAYRPILEHHGWGDVQTELHALFEQGRHEEMADVIDDEMLRTFAAVGTPSEVVDILRARYGDAADRITLTTAPRIPEAKSDRSVPFPASWAPLVEGLREDSRR